MLMHKKVHFTQAHFVPLFYPLDPFIHARVVGGMKPIPDEADEGFVTGKAHVNTVASAGSVRNHRTGLARFHRL